MPATTTTRQRPPPRSSKDTARRDTLTPQRWIEAATEVLVDRGIDNVRVDVLATELSVTRGSFYWHFRDREDLLRQVLQSWRGSATEQLTARLQRTSGDPKAQLRDVLSLPFRGRAAVRAARIELALRAWARHDVIARQAVDEADASRIDFISHLIESIGFAQPEARQRAFLLYSYLIAESQLGPVGTVAERAARRRFVECLLQEPLTPAASQPT
ncbi:TetR/AcrR family transcriptional regulator [Thiomonas sp. FB-Cd]|uniref:TetR/AcrR family transcriptional regulator n=1 Tax=Thiomonas sp. FB-Cd TaxID=1158292 RepID=UPI0004DF016E|nr:TetR/AcrR family transcriptional regulator [Thiomonas sp. FB-Cd]